MHQQQIQQRQLAAALLQQQQQQPSSRTTMQLMAVNGEQQLVMVGGKWGTSIFKIQSSANERVQSVPLKNLPMWHFLGIANC
jgi:hypothetical protein